MRLNGCPLCSTCEILDELYDSPFSEGTLIETCEQVAEAVIPFDEQVKEYLIRTEGVVHLDETGGRVDGKLRWMHVRQYETITHLEMHDKRGSLAHAAIGILPKRTGWVMHDGYRSYDQYPDAQHALCHHLRELLFNFTSATSSLAEHMLKFSLPEDQQAVESAHQNQLSSLLATKSPTSEIRYGDCIGQGLKAINPPPP